MADTQQIPTDPNDPQAGSVGAATLDPHYAEQAAIEYNKDLANQIRSFGQSAYSRLGAGGLIKTPGYGGVDLVTSPGRSPLFSGMESQFLDASSRQRAMQAQTTLNKKRSEDYASWMEGMAHELTTPPRPGAGEEEMDANGNWNAENSAKMSNEYLQWYDRIRQRMKTGMYMANLPGVADAMKGAGTVVDGSDVVTPIPGTKMFRYQRSGQRGVGLLLNEPQLAAVGGLMTRTGLGKPNPQVVGAENFQPQVVAPGQGIQQRESGLLQTPDANGQTPAPSQTVGQAGTKWGQAQGYPAGTFEMENHPEMGHFVKDAQAPNGMRKLTDEEDTTQRTTPYFNESKHFIESHPLKQEYDKSWLDFEQMNRASTGKGGSAATFAAFQNLIGDGHLDPNFAASIAAKLQEWKSFVSADGTLPRHVVQDMLVNGNAILHSRFEAASQVVNEEANMAQMRGVPKKEADGLRKMMRLPPESLATTKEKPGVPMNTPATTPPMIDRKAQPQQQGPSGAPLSPLNFLQRKGQGATQ